MGHLASALKMMWSAMFRVEAAIIAALAISTAAGLGAQSSAQAPQAPVFTGRVDAVVAFTSVRNRRGRLVQGLKKTDFEVIDSGFGRPIREFYAGSSPVSVAVLLDVSGSMSIGGNIDRARHAVGVAMTHLKDPGDEAALFTFDTALREVVGFTTEVDRVRQVNLAGSPWGQTSLFDAIAATARVASSRSNRHRAVLVITDGVDTYSQLTAAQASAIAGAIDVPVYLLIVANPLDHPGGSHAVVSVDRRSVSSGTLDDLARLSGGDRRTVSLPKHTEDELGSLFQELRYQYIIVFEAGPRPGWHPLEIRTPGKDLVVRARSGYSTVLPQSGS
jgi:VWFA-related protein